MRLDSRGDIGFAEAMTGTAVVCIVLSTFLVFAVTMVTAHSDDAKGFDWSLTSDVQIKENEYVWGCDLAQVKESMNLKGVQVSFSSGIDVIEDKTFTAGDEEGDVKKLHRVQDVNTDDGRRIPTLVTVILWS